jgi:hypothetical protein
MIQLLHVKCHNNEDCDRLGWTTLRSENVSSHLQYACACLGEVHLDQCANC